MRWHIGAGTSELLQAKRIPLLVRRGWRDIKKMARGLLIRSGRGGRSQVMLRVNDHPVCGAKVGFAEIFLMPLPPLLTRRGIRFARNLVYLVLFSSQALFAFSNSELADSVMRKDAQAVRTLLTQNADANVPQADGTTALHWAARWDDVEIAAALIRAGANPRAVNRDGATPMCLATLNGSTTMIDTLLKGGAEVNAPVLSRGETALMMAAR